MSDKVNLRVDNLLFTSPATFQAGTAALPAITTSGDTNTGIFFPAADTIAFSEGGVEAMRITDAGNVGIGTTAPLAVLDTGSSFRQRSANTTRHSYLKFVKSVSAVGTGANTVLSITVPFSSAHGSFILVEGTFTSSRAGVFSGNGNAVGASKVSKAYFAIARNSGNSDVVLNSDLASQNWNATTTTAGGSVTVNDISPAIARAGAEPNTDPQEVIITAVFGQSSAGPNSTAGICVFDVYVTSGNALSNFAIT